MLTCFTAVVRQQFTAMLSSHLHRRCPQLYGGRSEPAQRSRLLARCHPSAPQTVAEPSTSTLPTIPTERRCGRKRVKLQQHTAAQIECHRRQNVYNAGGFAGNEFYQECSQQGSSI
eukprot:GHRR01007334.1.p1 GENE.GHRR01007334.1~~GHRR01007334.1.p1  ORF type:complete len:116 (+),score=8.20 GHRR01007334.1:134-481(+)